MFSQTVIDAVVDGCRQIGLRPAAGLALVEVLSSCPTNNHTTAAEALTWIEKQMVPYYPLGDYKIVDAVARLN